MRKMMPSKEEFIKGVKMFREHEKRDAIYKMARFLVDHFWGDFTKMADSIGVLLLVWNQAFYRYGAFDFDKLEECLKRNWKKIQEFKERDLTSLTSSDEKEIKKIFDDFLEALQIERGEARDNKHIRKSPVAVAKALHLLAPDFFPLWDERIAKRYGCFWQDSSHAREKYVEFMKIMKDFLTDLKKHLEDLRRELPKVFEEAPSLLKLIDEYNYSKYTKGWIRCLLKRKIRSDSVWDLKLFLEHHFLP